eukprot:SAG22_NODE_1308_length_4787_cov_3.561860_3_plen_145_part_00
MAPEVVRHNCSASAAACSSASTVGTADNSDEDEGGSHAGHGHGHQHDDGAAAHEGSSEEDNAGYTNAADMWSLGCLMFELLGGVQASPFNKGEDIDATFHAIQVRCKGTPCSNSQLSAPSKFQLSALSPLPIIVDYTMSWASSC